MDVYSCFSVSLILIILLVMTACWGHIRRRKSTTLPPLYPGALPIIGHSVIMLMQGKGKDLWDLFKNVKLYALNNSKGACTIVLGNHNVHILTNPEDCLTVANTCIEKNDFYKFGNVLLGEGLVTGNGMIWKQHRKLLNPALNQQILNGYLGIFNRESKNLAESLKEKVGVTPFDCYPFVQKFALRNICQTTMDFNVDNGSSKLFHEYMSMLHKLAAYLMERGRKFWLYSDYLFKWSSLKRKEDKILNGLNKLTDKIIAEKETEMKNKFNDVLNQREFKPYLELLIDLKMRNVFLNKEVKEEAHTIIAAGYETTAIAITQLLIVLGTYSDVQEKVYRELLEILDSTDQDVSKQHLSQMKYLEAVIKESLRLYPVIPATTRFIDKDIRLKDYTLPAGDDVLISIWGLNRHSIWGTEADVFQPERWLDTSVLPEKTGVFASFSIGRRNCIGQHYAMMSMKTALTHILRHYKIKADVNNVKYNLQISLVPASGHHITLEERHL